MVQSLSAVPWEVIKGEREAAIIKNDRRRFFIILVR
jgi:hypothetical protein